MGMGAERYRARRDDRGMPYWQQLLLAQAAGPVVKEVVGLAGEGAKQLFLGRHSKGLMEGQRGTDIESMIKYNAENKRVIVEREKSMKGDSRNINEGALANVKQRQLTNWIKNHGALGVDNNQQMWNEYWDASLPEVTIEVNKDVEEFLALKKKYDHLPSSLEELNRRVEESDGWWNKTTGGRIFTRAKNFFTGESTDDQIRKATQKLLLGSDYINFKNTEGNQEKWKDFISGEEIQKDINTIWHGTFLESDEAMRSIIQKAHDDKGLVKFREHEARAAHRRTDVFLFQRTIQDNIDKATGSENPNPLWIDYLRDIKAGDPNQIRAMVAVAPSYKEMPDSEERAINFSNILNQGYIKKQIPYINFMNQNVLTAASPTARASLMSQANHIYNPYKSGIFSKDRDIDPTTGVFEGSPLTIAKMGEDPTTYASTITDLNTRVENVIKTVGNNFGGDYMKVMEDLRIAETELPTLRESEVKELYTKYVNTQILNNVGLKTSSHTNKTTQQTTPVVTLDILDKEGGQNLIKDFLNKRGAGSNIVKPNAGPDNADAQRLEIKINQDGINTTLTEKQLTDGWSITDDGKKNLSEKLGIESINELLGEAPTIKNLNTVTRNMVDAAHILKEEAGHENLHNSTYLYMQGVRESFAENYGIPLDKNDTFLRKIISGESDAEGGTLGDSEPNIEVSIVKDENVTEVPSSLSESKGIIEEEHPAKVRRRWVADKFEEAQEVTKSRQVHMKGWLNLSKEERVTTYEGKIENYIRAMEAESKQPSLLSRAS